MYKKKEEKQKTNKKGGDHICRYSDTKYNHV